MKDIRHIFSTSNSAFLCAGLGRDSEYNSKEKEDRFADDVTQTTKPHMGTLRAVK